MRTYKWGWEDDSWPHFSVDVPDGSELAIATTEYERTDRPTIPFAVVRVITVKLVFIDLDPEEQGEAISRHPVSFAPGALKLIDKETT